MADNHVTANGHPDMDYAEHEKTYGLFVSLTKWTIIGLVVLMLLMAHFLL